MKLLLVRHAIAVDPVEGISDSARRLTRRGRERMVEVARGLGRLDLAIDQLRHSPWTRAVETADLLAHLCKETVVEPLLARPPGEELLAALGGAETDAWIALVGHQPWMGQLCGWLVFGSKARGARLGWRKAGVALLSGDVRPGGMMLDGFLPPRVCRRLS